MDTYQQLCGALGVLKTNGAELEWVGIDKKMRDLGRRVGTATWSDPVHDEIRAEYRKYRDICLKKNLIKNGQLFNLNDCVPLI